MLSPAKSAALLRAMRDCAVVELDADLVVTAVSAGTPARLPFPPRHFIGKVWWEAVGLSPQATARVATHVAELKLRRPFRDLPLSFICRQRGPLHFLASGEPLFDASTFQGYVVLLKDRTEIEEETRARRSVDTVLAAVTENCPALIVLKDVDGRYVSINRRAAEAYGMAAEAVIGKRPAEILPPEIAVGCAAMDEEVLEFEEPREVEQILHVNGKRCVFFTHKFPIRDQAGCLTGVGAIGTDISELRTVSEHLYRQTHYDTETGQPNRNLLKERLDRALTSARRTGLAVGTLVVGLENIKVVSDALGRQVANQMVSEFSARLVQCVRETDTVGRLGDSEFGLLLADMKKEADIELVVRKVTRALSEPILLEGTEITPVAHIGAAVSPSDAIDSEAMLQSAGLALYVGRKTGQDYKRFAPDMNSQVLRWHRISDGLRGGVARREFRLMYQPIVAAATGRPVGAEALIRWQHADLGEVSPVEFIPVAEETGSIGEIGAWALQAACADAKAFHDILGQPLSVAVNVSLRQLSDSGFANYVTDCLAASGLPADLLKIELTESTLAADVVGTRRTLETLRAAGIHLSLDDFGTGYSSLSYLQQYPFDVLKIDRAFVRDVTENRTSATLADSIIQMAKRLGIRVLAEGVETPEQLEFLISRGCDLIQGYLFSKPLRYADFLAYAGKGRIQRAA